MTTSVTDPFPCLWEARSVYAHADGDRVVTYNRTEDEVLKCTLDLISGEVAADGAPAGFHVTGCSDGVVAIRMQEQVVFAYVETRTTGWRARARREDGSDYGDKSFELRPTARAAFADMLASVAELMLLRAIFG